MIYPDTICVFYLPKIGQNNGTIGEIKKQENTLRPNLKKPKLAMSNGLQTWGTVVVGVVMLLVGLVAGYLGRPFIELKLNPDTDQANQQSPNLKDVVVSKTRHFLGNPDAPVTIIEFSDFQ